MEGSFNGIDSKKLLEYQSKMVIELIAKNKTMDYEQATRLWYNSETKKYIQDGIEKFYWVSPARCYFEIELELEGSDRWMLEPFT